MQGSSLYRNSTGHVCCGNFRRDAFHYLRAENIWLSYILNRLFITSRVYLEQTSCPAPSWHVSSVGRALHYCLSSAQYCEDHFHSLNLFTRWLRSVVLKSLKAAEQKFMLKKKMWGNIEIKRMIRPSVKSENSVFLLQLERVSNSNKQQICSAAEHGPRWTKCT